MCETRLKAHMAGEQGYYRRGDANFALGNFKKARQDFLKAAKLAPKDADLRRKLIEAERIVKRLRFEESLSVPVTPQAPGTAVRQNAFTIALTSAAGWVSTAYFWNEDCTRGCLRVSSGRIQEVALPGCLPFQRYP